MKTDFYKYRQATLVPSTSCSTLLDFCCLTLDVLHFFKVLAMMTGELDVNSLLVEQPPASSPHRDLAASAYVAFVLFLFFVTIVLINLLVGIAVHDIEGLHKTAGLSKLVRQTELIYFLELALFHGYLPNCIMEWLKMAIFMSPGGYRVVVSVRPYSPREKRLPKEVMESALIIARARKRPGPQPVPNAAGAAADTKEGLLEELRKTQLMLHQLQEQQTLHKLLELADQMERRSGATKR